MANELTGDFDVVAEFSIPAANRILAAMHRGERFLHSLAVRVDDDPPPGSKFDRPTLVGAVGAFGDPTADHTKIGTPVPLPGKLSASHPVYSAFDAVVNTDLPGILDEPIVPSHLKGRAQLQLSPPTLEVPDASGTKITVRMRLMVRYFPDPNTSPLAEFVHGDLRITAPVNQVASQTANVIDIDIKASQLVINFTPIPSSAPLSAADLAAVSQVVKNALKTSFLPTNATLPSNIAHMQFKTLAGGQGAIAVLLNMNGARGNPASLNNVFLSPTDNFAFAAGRDFILGAFNAAIGDVVGQQFTFSFNIDYVFTTQHVVYTVSLNSATVDLQNGKILLTITGRATTPSWNIPNFNFRVRQAFTLIPTGATAELQNDGDVSLEITSGGIGGWLVSLFKNRALPAIRQRRDNVLNQTQGKVRRMLSAEEALGGFLKSLMNPAHNKPGPQAQEELKPELAYTSVEIRPAGIVLHGSLAVPAWPALHVEFEQIPANTGGGFEPPSGTIFDAPDYTALKSWIPGGTIQRYEWRSRGKVLHTDEHRFILVDQPPVVSGDVAFKGPVAGFTLFCLTVEGTRITSSGLAVEQPVGASACSYNSVSVIPGELVSTTSGTLPMVALIQPGPRGLVEVVGHASGRSDDAGGKTPNLIVHFADEKSADRLDVVTRALSESRREDAATAVLAVLAPEQMAKTRHTEGVIYAEDQGGAWERMFGVKASRRPLTLIVDPQGKVLWQNDGDIDSQKLSDALRKLPAARGFSGSRVPRSNLRIGRPAPNLLFEYAPGRQLTLRKLAGRPVSLIFWKSSSKPSLDAVRDLQETNRNSGEQGPVVLAINDGEAPELAKRVAAENRLSATLVTDPKRMISLAYGVSTWPTIIFIDAFGLVREIHYGRFAGEHIDYPPRENSIAAAAK